MADSARLTHVSPGIYSRETELSYAVKSLGITTLGLVGETKKGPAFQPMMIENWRDFQNVFGGTSPEKFKGTQYPKYELPYIAKSYLSESNQLQVCRVLGLSGYNAGPAWVLKAHATTDGQEYDNMVVGVIRSRGKYYKYRTTVTSSGCDCTNGGFDSLVYSVGEVTPTSCNDAKKYNMSALKLDSYSTLSFNGNACSSYTFSSTTEANQQYFKSTTSDYGRFTIKGFTGEAATENVQPNASGATYFEYAVSLNPHDNDYILKVLGTTPDDSDAPVYIECLYDVAFQQLVDEGKLDGINVSLETYKPAQKQDYCVLKPANDFVSVKEEALTRKDVGKRFLADEYSVNVVSATCHPYDYKTKKPVMASGKTVVASAMTVGQVYTVKQFTTPDGSREYHYTYYSGGTYNSASTNDKLILADQITTNGEKTTLVKVMSDGRDYRLLSKTENGKTIQSVQAITCDLNDYREQYRFASTPWFVSNLKGDAKRYELTSLFRFHTISDGNTSNNEIKVSIANIRPDDGTFDVLIRDINDSDSNPKVLESYTKCTLVPGSSTYLAKAIGSFDGTYETRSKYVTVEVNETLSTQTSVPAGFLGYPLNQYSGLSIAETSAHTVVAPAIKYNTYFDTDIKNRRQYFGLSDITGIDVDMFTYKGSVAYGSEPDYLSQGFHLDSRLDLSGYASSADTPVIYVDGISGYTFDSVSTNNRTALLDGTPVIAKEIEMVGSIYENVNLRKFTAYFYGGFDGWDIYRDGRSNTDDFKITKYKGDYNASNGIGRSVSRLVDAESLGLTSVSLSSDYYAYLAGVRQFANPEEIDINVFATPGIDLINNTALSEEVIEMIEEERADSIYVAVTPDKPMGASDYVDDMYTPEDIVGELENTEIDSNYTCTYYPWIKYEDTDNNQYVYLSPTKDVVRNMAMTDNTTFPWFAPAGVSRGDVKCTRAHVVTKLADEDTLYSGRINPIKTFASDGVKIWGQKNLQVAEGQLNRIAVRRLLLRMRKLIAIACIGLIFEPNDNTTKQKFLSTVTPIMDNIRANRGISDYRIEVNDTIESRERRELPAKIYFKVTNSLEYITLDFIVTPEAVSFDAI